LTPRSQIFIYGNVILGEWPFHERNVCCIEH